MREILFKAKRWSDGKWVSGDLLQYQDRVSIHHYVNRCRVSDDVDTRTVCQYTGLTDKNRKKIFEGDKMMFDAYGRHYSGFVEFVNGSFGVNCEVAHPFLDDAINKHEAVVTGNIHNKENEND